MMGGPQSNKKQREVYVGNLTIGAVTDVMLRELFNGALSHLMPNAELNPPVVNVGMDPSGACCCSCRRCCCSSDDATGTPLQRCGFANFWRRVHGGDVALCGGNGPCMHAWGTKRPCGSIRRWQNALSQHGLPVHAKGTCTHCVVHAHHAQAASAL
jgi:hypothetical protein